MTKQPISDLKHLITTYGSTEWSPLSSLPGITLTLVTEPTLPAPYVCEPAIIVVVQGRHSISLGDKTLDCGAGQYLVIPVDLPLQVHITEASPDLPYLCFKYLLKPDKIAALLLETEAELPDETAPPGVVISDMTQDLADAATRLVKLLDRPADIPALAASFERELLWRLVNGQQRHRIRQAGIASSRTNKIAMATRKIRSCYAETLRVEELARSVGMSVTSFHRHFRAVTAMTPIQYQKRIRLQMARACLLSTADDVAAVGYTVGYESPSQFSREYKRLFGYPPGEDGRRLRKR